MLSDTVRSVFIDFINANFRVDEWGLGMPKSSSISIPVPSIALDKPTLDFTFEENKVGVGERDRYIRATIPFQIMYRFDSSYRYATLPRMEAEKLLNLALLQLMNCSLHEDIEEIYPSGRVSVAETKNSDWLIIIELDIGVRYNSIAISNEYRSEIF